MKIVSKISRGIFILTIVEMVLGVNGRLLIVAGIPIRYILWLALGIGLVIECFLILLETKNKNQTKMWYTLKQELSKFSSFDRMLLIFLTLNSIWIVFVPLRLHASLLQAFMQVRFLLILAMYFLLRYLMIHQKINWLFYRKCALIGVIFLITIHVFLYVGESIQKEIDPSVKFAERLFGYWSKLVRGNCYFSPVLMPKYSVRIIYTFSYMLFLGIYFSLQEKKKFANIALSVGTMLALLTTGTRTIIVAPFFGIGVCYIAYRICKSNYNAYKYQFCYILFLFCITVVLDFSIFDGRMMTRFQNSFQISEEVLDSGQFHDIIYTDTSYTKEKEIAGTINSNTTRMIQLDNIVQHFLQRPILGYGYGNIGGDGENDIAYYDLQGPTLLVQTGLLGVFIWCIYLLYLVYHIMKQLRKGNMQAISLLFMISAVFFCSFFCYVVQSMTMVMILFGLLDYCYWIEYKSSRFDTRLNG